MVENVGRWDGGKILEMFLANIAYEILRVIILSIEQPNKMIWSLDKNDLFNVKSMYKLIVESQHLPMGESLSAGSIKIF